MTGLRLPILAMTGALVLLLAGAPAAWAEATFPPGLRIGLEPPPGMTVSKTGPGFEDRDREANIAIADLPAPVYWEMEKQVLNVELTRPGVVVERREVFPFADGMGYLVTCDLTADGKTSRRWFMLAVNPVLDLATLVTVEVPQQSRSAYPDEAVRAALATVTFRPTPIDEQVGLLPFEMAELAGFRPVRTFGRAGVMLAPEKPDGDPMHPYMIISVGPGAPQERGDRATFAQRLLAGLPVRDVSLTGSEPIRLATQPGHEIRAEAKDATGVNQLSIVQWVRFGSNGFLRIVGVSRKRDWVDAFPKFRAIRDGIDTR